MNTTQKMRPIGWTLSVLALASVTLAQEPKYAADVPEFLLTPDKVETDLLGDLEFFDGMPSEATVQKAYDFLDLSRGVQAFLNGMAAASIHAFLEGRKDEGLKPGDFALVK